MNKNVPGIYVVMARELDKESYNNVGITYEDYLCGWWVLLSGAQARFHELYPQASAREVLAMELDAAPARDALPAAKEGKLALIRAYDRSGEVNGFLVNGSVRTWLGVQERLNYKQSVEAAGLLGETTLDFLIEGVPFSVGVEQAEYMLAQIQRYADRCYMVTQRHIAAVNAMESAEEAEEYDHTQGYPEMLDFEL